MDAVLIWQSKRDARPHVPENVLPLLPGGNNKKMVNSRLCLETHKV
jgi:hypothetical protein